MSIKIGIIATEFLSDFIKNQIKQMDFDFEYELFLYDNFRDIPRLFSQIPDDVEGVMTSGVFPSVVIKKTFPTTEKIISLFNSDDAGICRFFLNVYKYNPHLNLQRVYDDFISLIGCDLPTYLHQDPVLSLNNTIEDIVNNMSLEEIFKVEEQRFATHIEMFKQGRVDFTVTRFSSIVKKLQNEGVKVYFPYPSFIYIAKQFNGLLRDIQVKRMQNSQPTVINIILEKLHYIKHDELNEQRQFMLLQESLVHFCGNSTLDYMIHKTHFGYEIFTDRKHILEYTDKFHGCALSAHLQSTLDFPVLVGYGIGSDLYQARLNAANAVRESGIRQNGSFVIDVDNTLIGPLGAQSTNITTTIDFHDRGGKKASGLSPTTINKVITAIKSISDSKITAHELSLKLNVTPRTANRFLKAMLQNELIEVVGEKRATSKGRPERVFKLCTK